MSSRNRIRPVESDRPISGRMQAGRNFAEEPLRSREYEKGAESAADLADAYNASSTHPYRLGDCILSKMNLRRFKPRKNGTGLEHPDHAWTRGFATALADVYRLLAGGNDPNGICRIAKAAGVHLADLRAAKVHPVDIRALQRAGLP